MYTFASTRPAQPSVWCRFAWTSLKAGIKGGGGGVCTHSHDSCVVVASKICKNVYIRLANDPTTSRVCCRLYCCLYCCIYCRLYCCLSSEQVATSLAKDTTQLPHAERGELGSVRPVSSSDRVSSCEPPPDEGGSGDGGGAWCGEPSSGSPTPASNRGGACTSPASAGMLTNSSVPACASTAALVGVVGGVPPGSEGGVPVGSSSAAAAAAAAPFCPSWLGVASARASVFAERIAGGLYGCRGDEPPTEDVADDVRSRVLTSVRYIPSSCWSTAIPPLPSS